MIGLVARYGRKLKSRKPETLLNGVLFKITVRRATNQMILRSDDHVGSGDMIGDMCSLSRYFMSFVDCACSD